MSSGKASRTFPQTRRVSRCSYAAGSRLSSIWPAYALLPLTVDRRMAGSIAENAKDEMRMRILYHVADLTVSVHMDGLSGTDVL